jgi:CDP-diacylglycerol--glycerol-3-phosphate 3-phosphatidyltransferase
MFSRLRATMQAVFTPLARVLMRHGVSPDAVTIAGTVVVTGLALGLLPTGHLFLGALLIGVFALFDSLDGVLARMSGRSGPWGAFLDSTLDRISDGAVFAGIATWFLLHTDGSVRAWGVGVTLACLVLGGVVPYARARAESVGADAHVGIAERSDRLVIALTPTAFVQFGLPVVVLVVVLGLLALASLITVVQRVGAVHRQLVVDGADPHGADPHGADPHGAGTPGAEASRG